MKRNPLVLAWLVLGVLLFLNQAWAACPQDTVDSGVCDTLQVEIWPGDEFLDPPGPYFARFPIYVTHDVPDPLIDSITSFVIPFCYTHTNPSKYCSLSSYWNNGNTGSFTAPEVDRSIFRHLPSMSNPQVHNWMMDQYQEGGFDKVWNSIVLSLDGTSHFWLTLIAMGAQNQKFGPETHRLLATMTFKLQDTMEICIDSCFWPPAARLAFTRSDAYSYIPRHSLPVCQKFIVCVNLPPYFSMSPASVAHHANGHFVSSGFEVVQPDPCSRPISSVSAVFHGAGVENVSVVYDYPPPAMVVSGLVEYEVIDHCLSGGSMQIIAEDGDGAICDCWFGVTLTNSLPAMSIPDSLFALAKHSVSMSVLADDSDNDSIVTALDAFWCKQDSLKPPGSSPSYSPGNPGLFTWVPTEADTGSWISSFSATDICGGKATDQVDILVGVTFCGDCTKDGIIDAGDLVYLINYLFKGGHAADPPCRGDVNCSGAVDTGDIILLVNYLYKGGTPPCFGCCAGK
ncbi:MAG: dockerin type I repeat-containing protein [Candidatus Zixiibacteriota bacterium]